MKRNELMEDFLSKFVDLLRESDPNPGLTRTEARVKFHRKFMMAVEVAFTKHSMMKQYHSEGPALTAKSLLPNSTYGTYNPPHLQQQQGNAYRLYQEYSGNNIISTDRRPSSANGRYNQPFPSKPLFRLLLLFLNIF